jgi:hypothetical protein
MQFGDRNLVAKQLEKVIGWVKPGGFIIMRTVVPTERSTVVNRDAHWEWTHDDVASFTDQFGLYMFKQPAIDNPTGPSQRMVWWWQKPGILKRYKIDPSSCEIIER